MSFSSSVYVTDEDKGTFVQQTKGLELKSKAGKEILEGYLTTQGVDKEGDIFTEDALRKIAEQVRDDVDTVDVVFPEADVEDFKEVAEDSTTGNIDHNNFPGFRFADSRIVPAFKIVDAEYDGFGVAIKAVLNSAGMLPETVDAVKNAIKEGFLNAFSIEFKIPRGATEKDRVDGEMVRRIKDARPVGAALTGRPANPRARITDTSLKSMMEELEGKASVAGVTFQGTKSGELDESELPNDDFESHYLFAEDTKSDSSYPVVDADGYLRKGNVESAYQLGARGGVSEEALTRKLKKLNEEFDEPPIDFEDEEGRSEAMNTTMTEEQEEEAEAKQEETPEAEEGEEAPEQDESPDGEESEDEGAEQEQEAPLADEVEELKTVVESVKEQNEELRQENEELREKLEDFETAEEVKSEIGKLRDELEDLSPEDEPVADDEEERMEETANKSTLERKLDVIGEEGSRRREQYVENHKDVLADKYNLSTEEVENHV